MDPFWVLNPGVLFTEDEASKEAKKKSTSLWSWIAWPTAVALLGAASYATSVYIRRIK